MTKYVIVVRYTDLINRGKEVKKMQRESLQEEILTEYIRNKEVRRSFARTQWEIQELLTFIHHGYADIHEKKSSIEKIKALPHLTEDERILVENVDGVYEHVIEMLYHPRQRCIFHVAYILEQTTAKKRKLSELLKVDSPAYDIFDSMEDLREEIAQYYQTNDGMMEFQVDLFHIPTAGKHTIPYSLD